MNKRLKFRDDGTFVIVQFTDTELIDEYDADPESPLLDRATRATMETVLEAERPDLIVFTGDLIASARTRDPEASFRNAVAAAEERRVPWAAVFGNHDSEGAVPRKRMHELQLEHACNVAEPDPPGVSGAGNFALSVHDADDRPAAALYFLDSGDYSRLDRVGGYDWIRRDQIDWYARESRKRTERNGGVPLPSLAFFHIPLPEYEEAWRAADCVGHKRERCSVPRINSGLFAAMAESGDVLGTFAGHDHANDYAGTVHGIRLCYGRSAKYIGYVGGVRSDPFSTGARVIRLKAGERRFETWIRQSDGTVAELSGHRAEQEA
ncbi:metallophosphoesterase family protein [Paenibacillus flagellatus]|uniref:Metallophosphoesterase n=1 Tax=Paenibacillus flagellatus TaxID=2211139 RepID=A0A2V5KQ95_9BACL|nr:metallophosphoesterase family protein [Paenibacillus flagellatus]PYI50786.1 metallophosphoesterase [Paenibacillus flagellatus]